MWNDSLKTRFVGQSGVMLQDCFRNLVDVGAVSGYVVSDLTLEEATNGVCAFCANAPHQMAALELISRITFHDTTRVVIGSLCLPLCSGCSMTLMNGLRTTKG